MKDENIKPVKKGIGRLFENLKNKIMIDFIEKWIAKILLVFRAKNPRMWGIIFLIATVLQFGLGAVAVIHIPGVVIPDEFLSLQWILLHLDITIDPKLTAFIMWTLMSITGPKGLTAYMKPEKREEAIAESQAKIAEIEAKKASQP